MFAKTRKGAGWSKGKKWYFHIFQLTNMTTNGWLIERKTIQHKYLPPCVKLFNKVKKARWTNGLRGVVLSSHLINLPCHIFYLDLNIPYLISLLPNGKQRDGRYVPRRYRWCWCWYEWPHFQHLGTTWGIQGWYVLLWVQGYLWK